MKIILLKDVPGTGKRNDIKEVAAGHAQNYLIPNKLAAVATEETMRKFETQRAQQAMEVKIHQDLALKNLESLSGKTLSMKGKANEEGHLFAGIHNEEIAKALKDGLKVELLPENIILDKPIKEIGTHTVEAESFGKKVSFILSVEKE